MTAADLVIEILADSEARLRGEVDVLLGIVADLAFENYLLQRLFERELLERVHGEAQLARERRRRYAQEKAAAA